MRWLSVVVALLGVLALALTATAADLELGKKVYAQKCASCHGADGKGNPKMEQTLKVKIPEMSSAAAKTDSELQKILVEGRKPMPSFKTLSAQELDAVAQYAKELGKSLAAAKK